MAAPRGFEPRFTDPKSAVLPARRRGSSSASEASRSMPRRQKKWSGRRDSNPRPSPWQGDALPTEPLPLVIRSARASDGAEGQNRTDDTRLFRAVLYQLSYLGVVAEASSAPSALARSGSCEHTDEAAPAQPRSVSFTGRTRGRARRPPAACRRPRSRPARAPDPSLARIWPRRPARAER
jgi:hypothetical protein